MSQTSQSKITPAKLIGCYLLLLAVLDLGWALIVANFGAKVLHALGTAGRIGASDSTALAHAGGIALFFVGLFQSVAFDFIGTIALLIGIGLWAALRNSSKTR